MSIIGSKTDLNSHSSVAVKKLPFHFRLLLQEEEREQQEKRRQQVGIPRPQKDPRKTLSITKLLFLIFTIAEATGTRVIELLDQDNLPNTGIPEVDERSATFNRINPTIKGLARALERKTLGIPSIRYPKDDPLPDQKWEQTITEYLQELPFEFYLKNNTIFDDFLQRIEATTPNKASFFKKNLQEFIQKGISQGVRQQKLPNHQPRQA